MPKDPNIVYSYHPTNNTGVTVYKNRVVFKEGGLFRAKEETILFRNIVSIELAGITQKLVIHTQAGKYEAGWLRGHFARKVQDAILENMN